MSNRHVTMGRQCGTVSWAGVRFETHQPRDIYETEGGGGGWNCPRREPMEQEESRTKERSLRNPYT